MDNPPDLVHLFFRQFWRILKMDYPSLVWKGSVIYFFYPTDRPIPKIRRNAVDAKQKKGMALITY